MFAWLSANFGTILIIAVLILVVGTASCVLLRDKKNGKHSCGGSCGHCPMNGQCGGAKK